MLPAPLGGGEPDCVSGMPGRHGNLGLLRKMLDFGSEIRREFGPRLHHHISEAQRFS
uniref:Uncharacterized protein n=1 Tax=Ralstonia solanacearum TaxID=305 RepID=A0A0S4W8J1_RALSL|nr:protein of unknown function [Ralstonia solanacearum]CUV33929.1 protein of unknown function [Ralstonia solanacearum]CUV42554.1 protein of unknown function [Ralstonia solanacearum]CUV62837.1 protein of unknown function [Ralstonia solanacearum]